MAGRAIARGARGVDPVCFAMVMATGIVSAALRQAGLPGPSAVLLAVAAAAFVILAAASCWRAAAHPADLLAGLGRPDRAFTSFAFVAACGVLGNGLAGDGFRYAAAVLATVELVAWLALTCAIPARLAAQSRARPAIAGVNGTWYLWAVATQSLAIAAVFLQADGLLPPWLAAAAGITAWSAGVVFYLAIMVLVVARLLTVGLGPADATAPYWVAMGAASISVFAAARILHIGGPALAAARPAVTGVAVVLWAVATGLIPVLATMTTARWLRPSRRPRYRPEAWAIVFPLGMYAMAGLRLGTAARLPLIHHIGAAAVWPAAAAWALTFAAMGASQATSQHQDGRRRAAMRQQKPSSGQATTPGAEHPTIGQKAVTDMKRYKVPGAGHAPSAA